MPNEGGSNQFGNFTLQPGYGDVQRQTQLTREAPISGAPLAAHALETPRRAKKQATRPGAQPGPVQAEPADAGPSQTFQVAAAWQQIAQVPGASPLVKQMAANAQTSVQ